MTRDTERALELIKPIAEELGIDVSADDKILYIDDIGIGISCNSTYATLCEFIGYLIINKYNRFRKLNFSSEQLDDIRAYWVSPQFLEKLKGEK